MMLVTQSCSTLGNPIDCSLPGFSPIEFFQARIPEWVAISHSRASSQPRDKTCISCVSCIVGGFFTTVSPGKPNTPPHFSKKTRCTGDNFLTSMWTLSSDHNRLQPETTTELENLCKAIVFRQCTTERTRRNPSEKRNAWGKLNIHPYFLLFPKEEIK